MECRRQHDWTKPRTVAEVLADRRALDDELWAIRARGEVQGSVEDHERYVQLYMAAFGITPENASDCPFRDIVTSGTYKGFVRGFKGEDILHEMKIAALDLMYR